MATKKVTSAKSSVAIKGVELEAVPITIVGTSPLITHCWSEKAKKEMRDKQTGVAKASKHTAKIPVNDFSLQKGCRLGIPYRRH